LLSSVVTFQLKPGFASLLAFVSSPIRFVSQAGIVALHMALLSCSATHPTRNPDCGGLFSRSYFWPEDSLM